MPLKDLRCDFNKERDTEILRSFGKTLETINRKPAAQFWQEVDGTSPPPRTDAIVQKFLGHTDLVGRVALSGDGRYAVTGSWDGKAIVWETASGKIINTFQDRPKWLQCVAISYYGKYVLTGSNDQTATLWDAPSGKKLQTFEGHTGAVESVALSLEAYPKHVLTGSRDNTAILWDAASGKKLQAFLGHTGLVKSVALSDDGKLVLTGSADKTAILWEAASGKKIYTFLGHTDKVNGVALSGDAKLVLTGSRDTTAILWEASGKKIQTFRGHTSGITDVALRHDGKLALTGSFDGSAILWDAASANKLQTFRGHADGVGGVALTRAGNLVLTGSSDKTAILWAVNAGPWQPLLDDKLTGWTRHDNKKPDDIVVAQVESEPVLRMRRENKDVYVATKIEVENHHLRLEFRTPPGKKSSGLSSGIVTTPEGGTGFTFIVDSNGNVMPSTWGAKYSPGLIEGGAIVPKEGPVNFASAALKPAGAWNQLDLVRLKDGLLCFVNGRFIGAMAGMRYAKDGKEGAIARTLIHVHSQPGEVEVRRIEVRAISVLPPELVAKAPFPPLDPAWLKMVAALPADKQIEAVKAELMKRNPGFDGELQHIVGKDNAVTELKFSTDNVSDILPLRALQGLQKLNCNGTFPDRGKLSDLSPLKNMPLVHLYCPANPISNLGPLSEMKLTHLWVHYTLVADLSPLRGMKLTLLNCGHKVTDLTPLKGMPLKEIALDVALAKRNAELLRSIPTLETINLQPAEKVLSGANIAFPPLDPAWLKAVAAMKAEQQVEAVKAELMKRNPGFDGMMEYTLDKDGAVTHLRFVTDKVADISPVRVLTALKALHCNATSGKKAKLADLSPLSDLKLETLGINATQVADLAPLRHMNLKNLWVADSLVSDLAPIMGMKGDLKALGIGRTKVADLSPLKEMEKLETLLMEGTLVTDLSRLKGLNLKRLRMENTKVADIDPLKGMPLKELDISFQVKRDAEILRSITTLETINGQTRDAFWKEVDAKKGGK
jgi:WD40 repeat protein/Leucine-rich repeat (LRR) protein